MKLNYNDFNKLPFKDLCSLTGIGKKTAKAIVSMRPFRSNNDLFKVKGLGKKILLNLGIEKQKKERKKWLEKDGILYPHYCFAYDERTEILDFFWRIPKEYRIYFGHEEESQKITAIYKKRKEEELKNLHIIV